MNLIEVFIGLYHQSIDLKAFVINPYVLTHTTSPLHPPQLVEEVGGEAGLV
jgi:hypothetical protein